MNGRTIPEIIDPTFNRMLVSFSDAAQCCPTLGQCCCIILYFTTNPFPLLHTLGTVHFSRPHLILLSTIQINRICKYMTSHKPIWTMEKVSENFSFFSHTIYLFILGCLAFKWRTRCLRSKYDIVADIPVICEQISLIMYLCRLQYVGDHKRKVSSQP